MNRLRQVFVNKPKRQLSEFRLLEAERKTKFCKVFPLMAFLFSVGWIPAGIVIFPFVLLFFWSVRKLSGY